VPPAGSDADRGRSSHLLPACEGSPTVGGQGRLGVPLALRQRNVPRGRSCVRQKRTPTGAAGVSMFLSVSLLWRPAASAAAPVPPARRRPYIGTTAITTGRSCSIQPSGYRWCLRTRRQPMLVSRHMPYFAAHKARRRERGRTTPERPSGAERCFGARVPHPRLPPQGARAKSDSKNGTMAPPVRHTCGPGARRFAPSRIGLRPRTRLCRKKAAAH
jgi:hypothetical protein